MFKLFGTAALFAISAFGIDRSLRLAPNEFTFTRKLTGPLIANVAGQQMTAQEQAIQGYMKAFPEGWGEEYRQELLADIGSRVSVDKIEIERGANDVKNLTLRSAQSPFGFYVESFVEVKVTLASGMRVYRLTRSEPISTSRLISSGSALDLVQLVNTTIVDFMNAVQSWRRLEQAKYENSTSKVFVFAESWANIPEPLVHTEVHYVGGGHLTGVGFRPPLRQFRDMMQGTGDYARPQPAHRWVASCTKEDLHFWLADK